MNSKVVSNPEWGLEAYRLCDVFSERLLQNAIYHYTSMQNLPSILDKNGLNLWFTDHRYLNDKLEGKYHLSVIRSVAERLLENNSVDLPVTLTVFRPIPTIAKTLETFTASRVFVGTPDAIRTHDLQSWCCLSNG